MQINGIDYTSRLNTQLRHSGAVSTPEVAKPNELQQQQIYVQQVELNRTRIDTADLGAKLTVLEDLLRTTTTRRQRSATALSTANLQLSSSPPSNAVLKSTEEVNATPTSFATFGPSWSGSSATLVTLDGVYDGAQGTDTLTFKVRKAGIHGADNLKLEIRRGDGSKLEDITIGKSDPMDAEYTLSNGITFSLGSGSLSKNDTFTLDVYDGVGSTVDPNQPLDGVRNQNPNLEYGLAVIEGSFEVNGIEITVTSGDSLIDVLDRITSSEAGVSASFDGATERVVLTQKTVGPDHDIIVANDSSGFLAATKLSDATVTPGSNGSASTRLSELTAFSSVQSGTILVNDVEIAVDVDVDSLKDILERITDSPTATNAFMVDDRYVRIRANDRKASLILEDGDTGLFAALGIREGEYQPVQGGKLATQQVREITRAVEDASQAFNHLFRATGTGRANSHPVQEMHRQIESAVSQTLDAVAEKNMPDLGVRIQFTPTQMAAYFGVEEQRGFETNLENHYVDLRELLIGPKIDQRGGLLGRMIEILYASLNSLGSDLGKLGTLINTFA